MIAGELEGLIEYDAFNKSEPATQTVGGRTFSTKDGAPKPNERQTGKLENMINKGKEFVDKQGGFEGLQDTYKNYKNYVKDDSPSDYEIGFGKSGEEKKKNDMDKDKSKEKKEDTIMGLPSMVVYIGIGAAVILFSVALYQATRPATA